jgi:hypothetical protein
MQTKPSEYAAPLGSADSGHLEFGRGAARVTLAVGSGDDELFRARFEGAEPMVLGDNGRVTVEYPRRWPSELLRADNRSAEIGLNDAVPWEIAFSQGAWRLRADLRGLALRSLEIRRGASEVEILLPEPRGVVRLRLSGGAHEVTVRRPSGVAAVLAVSGGASRLTFDEQRFGALGGTTQLSSPGAAEAPDRYEIEFRGGASEVAVVAGEPG